MPYKVDDYVWAEKHVGRIREVTIEGYVLSFKKYSANNTAYKEQELCAFYILDKVTSFAHGEKGAIKKQIKGAKKELLDDGRSYGSDYGRVASPEMLKKFNLERTGADLDDAAAIRECRKRSQERRNTKRISRKRGDDSVRGAPEAKRQNNGDNNEQSMMGRVLGYILSPFKSVIGAATSSSSE